MEPHARAGSPDRRRPLGQQGGDDACQHIAAAALGQAGIAGGVHQHVPLRRGRHGPVALQHQHAAMDRGELPGRSHPVAMGQIPADPGKLPVVRRQDGHTAPSLVQHIYMSLQSVYAVGVQNHRLFRMEQQITHQPGHLLVPPHARSQGQGVAVGQLFLDFL